MKGLKNYSYAMQKMDTYMNKRNILRGEVEMYVSNRDRDKCMNCQWYSTLNCMFVKIDGTCSLTGIKVAKDYTYGRSLNDKIIHR